MKGESMNPILKKLGLKEQAPVLIINAPEEFIEIMNTIDTEVHNEILGKYSFIQVFARNMAEAKKYAEESVKALEGDGHLWLCYPKGTSKRYKSDLNRNTGFGLFSIYEFEPVSQVAIDEDWSALRFRHINNIKTLKRKTAATEKGKERIKE
jgi:hypothetical protein